MSRADEGEGADFAEYSKHCVHVNREKEIRRIFFEMYNIDILSNNYFAKFADGSVGCIKF